MASAIVEIPRDTGMRHLLTVIIVIGVILITILSLFGKYGKESEPVVENKNESPSDSALCSSNEDKLLAESDGIKVYVEYGLSRNDWSLGDDMYYKDDNYLVKCKNDMSADTMILVGPHNGIYGDGNLCKVVVGIDTVKIDIRQPFDKTFDLRFKDAIPGCLTHRLSHHHSLNDISWPTDFQINIAMKDNAPIAIKDFISGLIRDDVAAFFTNYTDDNPISPDVPSMKMNNRTIEQMMNHYYSQFCKLYDKEFMPSKEDEIPLGDRYSYQFYACPVWQNSDSTLTTYRFYNFGYMGGAHGAETEYFLTFENKSGRILCASDFFSSESFQDAIAELTSQLNEHFENEHSEDYEMEACLDEDSNVTAVHNKTLNEKIGGKLYPRPAITKHGIVFSYQTYEIGSNADGILHFVIPFPDDFKLASSDD